MNRQIEEELYQAAGEENVEAGVLMSNYTSFKVGGPADFLVTPRSITEISNVINCCNKNDVSFFVMGNGSNLLVKDSGYRGVVIQLNEKFGDFTIEDKTVRAQAGVKLTRLAKAACEASLAGLEFASGIPGTLGGAVTMNAGAYGGEMSQVVASAVLMDRQGGLHTFYAGQMEFDYRESIIEKKDYIFLEAFLQLKEGDKEQMQRHMQELVLKRRQCQPLEFPSAGSTFKRPTGYYAGKLIMDAGLAGYRVGDAQVSPKHCGFVINLGNATAENIITLMDEVTDRIYNKYGVILEPEVKILG